MAGSQNCSKPQRTVPALLLAAILQFCLSTVACVRAETKPPNILLITLDTTRADHIGAYGDARARTSRLDRLAAAGVLFERAVSAAPITLPAHASLLTGRYPFAHGVRDNGNFSLTDRMATLATALHDSGYRTGAFVSAFVLDRRFGLARGFDRYDDTLERANTRDAEVERRGDRTAAAAAEWIASASGQPFFAWVHLYDPHDPYDPPEPFRSAFADRPYDGEIAFDDEVIGRLLDRLDALDVRHSTIVAVVGDHGESLGEHEEATHSPFVDEATLRVPLIIAFRGRLPSGRRVAPLVRTVDVAPTLLALAGRPPLAGIDGETLALLIEGRSSGERPAYSESYFPWFSMHWAPLRSVQDGRWKYIDAPEPELYDLTNDARERTNLAAREPARAAALRRGLEALTAGASDSTSRRAVDPGTAQK